MQQRVNISIGEDTLERLDQFAFEQHMSRSQAITALVWKAGVKGTQIRGQLSVDEMLKGSENNARQPGHLGK